MARQQMKSKNKANGSAGYAAKPGANGGALLTSSAASSTGGSGLSGAGSVDASELAVANAALSTAAGAARTACADPAELAANGKRARATGTASEPSEGEKSDARPSARAGSNASAAPRRGNRFAKIPAGREALPIDGEAFVDAVHSQVDLVQLQVALLRSQDEKIVQREVASLRELLYGKRATGGEDEPAQIIFDMPGPERDKQ